MSKPVSGLAVVGVVAVGAAILAALAHRNERRHELSPLIHDLYARVVRHFNFPPPPLIEDHAVANAQSDGRSIRVNPSWVSGVLAASCDNQKCSLSFIAGVLAHELGHHAHRVAGVRLGGHAEELRADYIAGQALRAAGFSSGDFRSILGRISGHGSETHPPGWQREGAIAAGFDGRRLLV